MKKALWAGTISFLVIGVVASIVGAQRSARPLDPTAFQLGGWAADEALWFDPFQLTTLRPKTTVLAPRLASIGSSSPGTKAAPSTAAALASPLAAVSSPEAPTSLTTTALSRSPELDQTLSGSGGSPVLLSARPPIRIPYRPELRSPFKPPL
jgi:hypothetical protein